MLFGVRELTPRNFGSDVALIDGANCMRRIARLKEQKSSNQLSTADGSECC